MTFESEREILRFAGDLKRVPRTGWLQRGVLPVDCESVADHSYRMALMAMLFFPHMQHPQIDTHRLCRIALVHDLAEAVVGDITPEDGVSKEEKRKLEREAMRKICGDRSDLMELWEEYEMGETLEAKVVKDLDKLEMILSAEEYEKMKEQDGKEEIQDLEEFFEYVKDKFNTQEIKDRAMRLIEQRELRKEKKTKEKEQQQINFIQASD
jgi:putative hydrolases of HD superfamily